MPGISLGLKRIGRLLALVRSPELALPVIHVAGTNGKGSVCAYISSILSHAGVRAASFNSPHLVNAWDCIRLGKNRVISERDYSEAKATVEEANDAHSVEATTFEVLTATAFLTFARHREQLDVAIVEVGMGGATDATNVVPASNTLLSIVTPISLDHQKFLGETVAEIASVKAGIIKPGPPGDSIDVVLAKQEFPEARDVVIERAKLQGAALHDVASTQAPVNMDELVDRESYQYDNATTAAVAIDVLRHSPRTFKMVPALSCVTNEHIKQGIRDVQWDGRLSRLTIGQQRLVVDGAHNASSVIALARYVKALPTEEQPRVLLTALSHPRSPSLLDPLLSLTRCDHARLIRHVIAYPFRQPEGMQWVSPVEPSKIVEHVRAAHKDIDAQAVASFEEALNKARDISQGKQVLVAGSLYGISEVYSHARSGHLA